MACGWQAPAQGNDPDVQETPAVQGGREGAAGVGMAPHGAVGRENLRSELSGEAVCYVVSAVKNLKFSLCILYEKNFKSYFKLIQMERNLYFSFPSSTGFV